MIDEKNGKLKELSLKKVAKNGNDTGLIDEKKNVLKPLADLAIKDKAGIDKNIITEKNTDSEKGKEDKSQIIEKRNSVFQSSTPNQTLQSDTSAQSSILTGDSLVQKREVEPDSASLATNHLPHKVITDSVMKRKGRLLDKHWQFGVMAESGVVFWGKGLLSTEKSFSNPVTVPAQSDALIDSLVSAGTALYQSKNGVSAGAGVIVRKDLSGRFYFTSRLSYRYQQNNISKFLTVPSQLSVNGVSYLIGSNDYRTHFLNLSVSAGVKMLAGKRNALSAEAGIDNSFLFATQRENNTQTGSFSWYKNITADFYRWQPQLSAALPFDWLKGDKVRLQVSPYARFGLHTFQKEGNAYKNNHLVSAGIQAVYFFK